MEPLAERYHELMGYRSEALRKYRTSLGRIRPGPPYELVFPRVRLGAPSLHTKFRRGRMVIDDISPVVRLFDRWLAARAGPLRILEFGPGEGPLADHVYATCPRRIVSYEGIERDPNVGGRYTRIPDIAAATPGIDLVLAIEVIEHMSAQDLYDALLVPLAAKLAPDATFMLSTPNPLAPAGIARDFTHIQNYPWYDLYALLRLVFERVEIYRTYYSSWPLKLALLPLRQAACAALELDWCDGIVAFASTPRRS
jgi:hypothetical protein